MSTLRITEIFYSLQGETKAVGLPTVFVRLTGCPLRCSYCDTAYAFHGGDVQSLASIIEQVEAYQPSYVTVTGGEPLAQPACRELMTMLCDKGYQVSIETSGALSIADIDPRVSVVMDLKTPSSNESHRNLYENIPLLRPHDQVKFVVANEDDYQWTRFKIDEYGLNKRVEEVLLSPSFLELPASQLADWVVRDRLPVRMQLQLHKILWQDEPGR